MSIGTETHEGQHRECPECFKVKLHSLQWLGMSPKAEHDRLADRRFDKDAEAYRRLRKEGIQPRHIDGSATLEHHADHKIQVELGHDVPKSILKAHNRDLGAV